MRAAGRDGKGAGQLEGGETEETEEAIPQGLKPINAKRLMSEPKLRPLVPHQRQKPNLSEMVSEFACVGAEGREKIYG